MYSTWKVNYADSVAENKWSTVYAANYQPKMSGQAVRKQVIPNVKGMGLKDALYLLENMGLKVQVKGKGKVVMQSVAPGSAAAKGNTITIDLAS